MSGSTRPSRDAALPLRNRNRVSYRELSSDLEIDDDKESKPSNERRPSRKRQRVSYHDASSESSEEFERPGGQPSRPRVLAQRPSRAIKAPSTSSRSAPPKKKRQSLGAKRTPNGDQKTQASSSEQDQDFDIPQLGGKIPPWQILPYEILLQVFQYASYPLISDIFEPNPSFAWLVKTALLCKGFAEPALSALYYAPPLWPPLRVHQLIATLANQTETSSFNYRAKVKYLDIEALKVLGQKSAGRQAVRLADLISMTPQLRGIGLHLRTDCPAYGNSSSLAYTKRINHHANIYSELDRNLIRLRSWTWNSHLEIPRIAHEFEDIHRNNAFNALSSLSFINSTSSEDVQQFITSTAVLPRLKSLVLENCSFEQRGHLRSLPKNLECLVVSNIQSIESSVLAPLLATYSGKLKELVLDHNQALDLAFLPQLASSCPNLEKLRIDLRFFNAYISFRDVEPHFDALMTPDMVPKWPRTLQRLELYHLRKWDRAAADVFFSSLVDSAAKLPDLRHIDIKASINESNWRDRISFRNKWQHRMERVFKRVSAPPDPRLRSIPVFMKHKHEFRNGELSNTKEVNGEDRAEAKRKFSHVQLEPAPGTINISSDNDSDAPLASRLRSRRDSQASLHQPQPTQQSRKRRQRKPKRKRPLGEFSSTEEDSALEDLDNLDEDSQHISDDEEDADMVVQGMCDIVRVAIDNLRPTEEHLNESNFLDEEISGDEDWVGD
ncbi:MAG: hypothetical protein Q9168_006086 [Polycauliona sp. 1 TL-2023]